MKKYIFIISIFILGCIDSNSRNKTIHDLSIRCNSICRTRDSVCDLSNSIHKEWMKITHKIDSVAKIEDNFINIIYNLSLSEQETTHNSIRKKQQGLEMLSKVNHYNDSLQKIRHELDKHKSKLVDECLSLNDLHLKLFLRIDSLKKL